MVDFEVLFKNVVFCGNSISGGGEIYEYILENNKRKIFDNGNKWFFRFFFV